MRYLLSAKVRPEKRAAARGDRCADDLARGFRTATSGACCAAGVDQSGTVRWVEVCYCREFSGVAMLEEIDYFEEFLTEIEIADARSPVSCEGYPACNDCDCTNKVRFRGEPFLEYLRRIVSEPTSADAEFRPTDAVAGLARPGHCRGG